MLVPETLLDTSSSDTKETGLGIWGSTSMKVRTTIARINIVYALVVMAVMAVLFIAVLWLFLPASAVVLSDPYDNPAPFVLGRLNDDSKMGDMAISSRIDAPFQIGCRAPDYDQPRASAALVMLARNSEVDDVVKSMVSMERHFNQWYNYPWVFLNDEPFDDNFKATVAQYTSSEVEFGQVAPEDWNFRPEVNRKELLEHIHAQGDRQILYGNLESYHKMCRFYSGFFYKHELVKKRDWYWRVEPDVEFYCDLTYDPFVEMEKHNKKYGFNVFLEELYYTIPGLFRETKAYIRAKGVEVGSAWKLFIRHQKHVKGNNKAAYGGLRSKKDILQEIEDNVTIKKFLSLNNKQDNHVKSFNNRIIRKIFERARDKPRLHEDQLGDEQYNFYHFWSNFEIARTDIFNSPEYEAYFKHLDESGGFYKERWGDAPVHSLAVGMFLNLEDIHYFRDIGYKHSTLAHCPGNAIRNQLAYELSPKYTDTAKAFKIDAATPAGVGCRCVCPPDHKEIEESSFDCIARWSEYTSDAHRDVEAIDVDQWEKKIEKKIEKYLETGGELGNNAIVENMKI